jgi:hypothetical protein
VELDGPAVASETSSTMRNDSPPKRI